MNLGYKKPKSEVDYSRGMARAHCGICRYFVENQGSAATCKKVAGVVSDGYWCKLFKKS